MHRIDDYSDVLILCMLKDAQLDTLNLSIALTLKHQRHTLEPSEITNLIETKIEVEAEILRRRHAHTPDTRT